jgi:hypothetical protein
LRAPLDQNPRLEGSNVDALTLEEVERVLADIIRNQRSGKIGAIGLWIKLHPELVPAEGAVPPGDEFAQFDQLAARRDRGRDR